MFRRSTIKQLFGKTGKTVMLKRRKTMGTLRGLAKHAFESEAHEKEEDSAMKDWHSAEKSERKAKQTGNRKAWEKAEKKEHGALKKLVKAEEKEHGQKVASLRGMLDEIQKIAKTKVKSDRPHYGKQLISRELHGVGEAGRLGLKGMAYGVTPGAAIGSVVGGISHGVRGGLVGAGLGAIGGAAIGGAIGSIIGEAKGRREGIRRSYEESGYEAPSDAQLTEREIAGHLGHGVSHRLGESIFGEESDMPYWLGEAGERAADWATQRYMHAPPKKLKKAAAMRDELGKIAVPMLPGLVAKSLKASMKPHAWGAANLSASRVLKGLKPFAPKPVTVPLGKTSSRKLAWGSLLAMGGGIAMRNAPKVVKFFGAKALKPGVKKTLGRVGTGLEYGSMLLPGGGGGTRTPQPSMATHAGGVRTY
jgi:hypothetical protein